MPIPRVTDAQVRAAAAELNVSPDEAAHLVVDGQWARQLWNTAASSLPPAHPARSVIDRAVLFVDSSHARTAETERDGDRAKVRIHFGMAEWCYIFARTVTPYLVGPDGGHGKEQNLEHVALLMAYPLSWLTSPAEHPREAVREQLTVVQESYAGRLGEAAQLFVLAHEMAHVAAGQVEREPDPLLSRMRELIADAWAVERLMALGPRDDQWQLGLTLPGVAVFLCAEALREGYAELPPSESHPTARHRLTAIRHALGSAGVGEDLKMMEGVIWVFDQVMPHIQRIAPGTLVSKDDLREMAKLNGADPATVPDGATLTWRQIYGLATVEALRDIAKRVEPPTEADVEGLFDAVHRMPAVVIEQLVKAYEGRLLPADDPDAAGVHELGHQLIPLLPDAMLREAIIPL